MVCPPIVKLATIHAHCMYLENIWSDYYRIPLLGDLNCRYYGIIIVQNVISRQVCLPFCILTTAPLPIVKLATTRAQCMSLENIAAVTILCQVITAGYHQLGDYKCFYRHMLVSFSGSS